MKTIYRADGLCRRIGTSRVGPGDLVEMITSIGDGSRVFVRNINGRIDTGLVDYPVACLSRVDDEEIDFLRLQGKV